MGVPTSSATLSPQSGGKEHVLALEKKKENICYALGRHPVAVVQYTFTHKQYTEKHTDTEYIEWNIHANKNT